MIKPINMCFVYMAVLFHKYEWVWNTKEGSQPKTLN